MNVTAWIETHDSGILEHCILVNASETGAKLEIADVHDLPLRFKLHLVRQPSDFRECRVVWQQRNEVGVQFQ